MLFRSLESNIGYMRAALLSAQLTYKDHDPKPVQDLGKGDPFFFYQNAVHEQFGEAASHDVIEETIHRFGRDYRFELSPHPVKELQAREADNTQIGRDPHIPGYTGVMPS